MSDFERDDGVGLAAKTSKPKLQQPPRFKVVLLNDDFTPMEFVIEVLQRIFRQDRETAVRIMLKVHTTGAAVAGTYTAEIAETKMNQVIEYARRHQHPLLCRLEQA